MLFPSDIVKILNNYRKHIDIMIYIYTGLTITHIITCFAISFNGYILHHLELSTLMIIMNFINLCYYIVVKNSIFNIFGKANCSPTIKKYIDVIGISTYIDIILNIIVLILITVLFSLWLGHKYDIDRNLLIFEYVINTLVNIFSLSVCYFNILTLKKLFNRKHYEVTSGIDLNISTVKSPIIEV